MTPSEARACFAAVAGLPGIEVRGLMTMAPQGDREAARVTFAGLAGLGAELGTIAGTRLELSMGMSEDFELAVAAGSTIVRLGRVAFDPDFPLQ